MVACIGRKQMLIIFLLWGLLFFFIRSIISLVTLRATSEYSLMTFQKVLLGSYTKTLSHCCYRGVPGFTSKMAISPTVSPRPMSQSFAPRPPFFLWSTNLPSRKNKANPGVLHSLMMVFYLHPVQSRLTDLQSHLNGVKINQRFYWDCPEAISGEIHFMERLRFGYIGFANLFFNKIHFHLRLEWFILYLSSQLLSSATR